MSLLEVVSGLFCRKQALLWILLLMAVHLALYGYIVHFLTWNGSDFVVRRTLVLVRGHTVHSSADRQSTHLPANRRLSTVYSSYTHSLPPPTWMNRYPLCSLGSKDLMVRVNISLGDIPLKRLEEKYDYLKPGGHNVPKGCRAASRVAVVIAMRDRYSHLRILLNHMHSFLTKQNLEYSIIVVEQVANQTFNKAKLFNVGFMEANKWECYLFHDVDLLPEDDRNMHVCPTNNPRHMAVAVNKHKYKLFYGSMVGGSVAFTRDQFYKTNGFSNRYWGWGREDDDMYKRIILAGFKVDRYNETIARYTMIKHERDKANPVNPCGYELLRRTKDDWRTDGLNSLHYKVVNITLGKLFTHILVDSLETTERPLLEAGICRKSHTFSNVDIMNSKIYAKCELTELNGRVRILLEKIPLKDLEKKYNYLKPGGHNVPKQCRALNRVAVIIPYRDRESHLPVLLNNMHSFLTKQRLDYAIIVVEQVANQTFNRAKLFNVGYVEAKKLYDWECYGFHDVDLLPENDRNLHTCPTKNPRHLAVAVDKFHYKLLYAKMFGTSTAFTRTQFEKVNGFSNWYWGWGGDDDDMYTRVNLAGYKVDRYNASIARYTMIKDGVGKGNPANQCRYKLLNHTKFNWKADGLNTLHYKKLNITFNTLYTHILVDLLENTERPPVEKKICR